MPDFSHGLYDSHYLGRYQLGDSVPLGIQSREPGSSASVYGQSAPAQPATGSRPSASIYAADGNIVGSAILLPVVDRYKTLDAGSDNNWWFARSHLLDSNFSTGRHIVIYTWKHGSTTMRKAAAFDIFDGGDPDGSVITMNAFQRPEAVNVLYDTQSGKLQSGRNPA